MVSSWSRFVSLQFWGAHQQHDPVTNSYKPALLPPAADRWHYVVMIPPILNLFAFFVCLLDKYLVYRRAHVDADLKPLLWKQNIWFPCSFQYNVNARHAWICCSSNWFPSTLPTVSLTILRSINSFLLPLTFGLLLPSLLPSDNRRFLSLHNDPAVKQYESIGTCHFLITRHHRNGKTPCCFICAFCRFRVRSD